MPHRITKRIETPDRVEEISVYKSQTITLKCGSKEIIIENAPTDLDFDNLNLEEVDRMFSQLPEIAQLDTRLVIDASKPSLAERVKRRLMLKP